MPEDAERARQLGEQARQFVVENYDLEAVFRHLDTILNRCQHKIRRHSQ